MPFVLDALAFLSDPPLLAGKLAGNLVDDLRSLL